MAGLRECQPACSGDKRTILDPSPEGDSRPSRRLEPHGAIDERPLEINHDEAMHFSLVAAPENARPVLRRLVELYLYDFSEFDGADVGPHGEYGYRYLDHYWTDPDRHAFL